MEKEQIVKALECCTNDCCRNCPIRQPNATCVGKLMKNALSLIREQDKRIEEIKAVTVRKMEDKFKDYFSGEGEYAKSTHGYIRYITDQIAKEMLEDKS